VAYKFTGRIFYRVLEILRPFGGYKPSPPECGSPCTP
jgi:hypothetical protein